MVKDTIWSVPAVSVKAARSSSSAEEWACSSRFSCYITSCLLGWWLKFTQNQLLVTQMTKNRVKNFSSSAPPLEWMKMFEVKSCTKLIAAWCPLMSLSGTLGGFQSHSVNEEMSCSLRFRLWLRIGRRTCFSQGRRQLLGGADITRTVCSVSFETPNIRDSLHPEHPYWLLLP